MRIFLGNDDEGATAVEYAMLAAFIAALIVTTVAVLGTRTNGLFGAVGVF
jgi:Flp pilus assembly pilin Flp